jgi:hypothetical protein
LTNFCRYCGDRRSGTTSSAPTFLICVCTEGVFIVATVAALSFSTIAAGVPLGRKKAYQRSASTLVKPWNDHFRLLAADHTNIPNLAALNGQRALDPLLDGVELIVLDNLSTLCWSGSDNDAGSWTSLREWLLRLPPKTESAGGWPTRSCRL